MRIVNVAFEELEAIVAAQYRKNVFEVQILRPGYFMKGNYLIKSGLVADSAISM